MATKSQSFQQTLDTDRKTSDAFDTRLYANSAGGSGFTVSIVGTFVATLHLLMSPDGGAQWIEYTRFETADVFHVPHAPAALWKLDCSGDGDFTSGSIFIEFARGSSGLSALRLLSRDRRFIDQENPLATSDAAAIALLEDLLGGGDARAWQPRGTKALDGTSQNLVAARAGRKGLIVQNRIGNNLIYLDPAGGVLTDGVGWAVLGGDQPVRFLAPDCPQGVVTVFGSSGETVDYWELT
jgi:hypothetical protein